MAGQITNADLKSEAELIADGFDQTKLTHTEKIYDPNFNDTLDNILFLGKSLKPIVIGSPGAPQDVGANIDLSNGSESYKVVAYIQGNGGPVTLTLADITGYLAQLGVEIDLVGCSDANTVEITDGHNGPVILTNKKIVTYIYNGTELVEKGRN